MIDITYNRQEKRYEWISPDGELITRPAKQKHSLFVTAAAMIDADLVAAARSLIAEFPQLERVTWRAVELIIDGAVDILPEPVGQTVAQVRSSDQYGRYAIQVTAPSASSSARYQGLTCQCPHWNGGDAPVVSGGFTFCKHVTAYVLSSSARRQPTS